MAFRCTKAAQCATKYCKRHGAVASKKCYQCGAPCLSSFYAPSEADLCAKCGGGHRCQSCLVKNQSGEAMPPLGIHPVIGENGKQALVCFTCWKLITGKQWHIRREYLWLCEFCRNLPHLEANFYVHDCPIDASLKRPDMMWVFKNSEGETLWWLAMEVDEDGHAQDADKYEGLR